MHPHVCWQTQGSWLVFSSSIDLAQVTTKEANREVHRKYRPSDPADGNHGEGHVGHPQVITMNGWYQPSPQKVIEVYDG